MRDLFLTFLLACLIVVGSIAISLTINRHENQQTEEKTKSNHAAQENRPAN